MLAGAMVAGDWTATIAHLAPVPLNLALTVVVVAVFAVGCLAIVRAPAHLRRFVTLTVAALFFQTVHNALWYFHYLPRGGAHVSTFGTWMIFLWIALALGLAAAWVGVRDILRPRDALLDYSIVAAAAASVAVAIVAHRHTGWSFATTTALLRCLLSVLTVAIITSAALGRWQALPIPVGLVGASLVFDAAGFLWYFVAQRPYTTDRWPTALWFTAAVLGLVAGWCVIAGIDRPIRLARHALPGVCPVSLLAPALGALGVAAAVSIQGALSATSSSLFAGIGAIVWIAVAALLRSTAALSEARTAYRGLDAAHLELEQAHEHSAGLVAKLARRNLELTTIQTMLGEVFEIADERTDGQLRSNLEETGADLARWLPHGPPRPDDPDPTGF